MSGFAVELRRDGREASVESANRMKGALRIFGPDRQMAKVDGPFALSWTQSAGFTPQDRFERQPVSAQERWHLLFLGRLNHRGELAEKLGVPAAELSGLADCELAMKAWCKWHEGCREHLYGRYSLVVCDTVNRQLVAMRSPERSQHIYYYLDTERLILASSTKAIFAFPEIPREVDELKIADLLVLNHEDAQRSYFRNISIIGQANTFKVGVEGEPRIAFHDCFASLQPIRYAREDDYVERARELLDQALDTAFRAPGLPAISLSAGLDSTTIAVAMIERMRREGIAEPGALKAYTAIPSSSWDRRVREGRMGDESGPVRALAAMYPELDVEFVSGENFAFDQEIDMMQSYADMPIRAVGNSAWGAAVRQQCRMDQRAVLVNGSAGNGTISFAAANILFAQWLREGHWGKLVSEVRKHAAKRPDTSALRTLIQAVVANLPDSLYDQYLKLRGYRLTTGYKSFSSIHPDFARDIGIEERLSSFDWDDSYRLRPDRRAMMRIMMQAGAHNEGGGMLEAGKVMSGIENVSALEDRKLMEFCYAIPDDQFYRDGVDRRLIRRMMQDKLPREVLTAGRGEQGADWHSRGARDLDRIAAELDRCADIPSLAGRIDIARMKRVIESWPDETPVSLDDYPDYAIARYGIGRALSVARFINQVEGRN